MVLGPHATKWRVWTPNPLLCTNPVHRGGLESLGRTTKKRKRGGAGVRSRDFSGCSWVFSEPRSDFGIGSYSGWQSMRGPEGHLSQKKKNNLGRETETSACEKGPVWGCKKRPPSQTRRPWVPVTLCQQNKATKSQNKRGPTLRPQRGFPWPSLGRGGGRRAPRACRRSSHWLGLLVKRVKPQNKRGKHKPRKRSQETPLPPRVPRKRASEGASELKPRKFKENPKNARGPEWHPEENAKKQDARPKWAEQSNAAGQHKKNKTKENKCVWGCPVTT